MHTLSLKNQVYTGAQGRASLYDITLPKDGNGKIILFLHGYMGYKDWGAWNLMEDFFVNAGYGYVKFNISHNGGTISNPIDFDDLGAFSSNSYSKELDDFECIVEEIKMLTSDQVSIYVIGHSRGGGMALLQSANPSVQKIASLAGISSIENRFPKEDELAAWKESGVYHRLNGRTQQQMPHRYDQYTDFLTYRDRLSIEHHVKNATIPLLIIHGEEDKSVLLEEGERLAEWSGTTLIKIPHQQHTFGASQPWDEKKLPLGLEIVCEYVLTFFNS